MFLAGHFSMCDGEEMAYVRDAGLDFAAPLCLAATFALQRDLVKQEVVPAAGSWDQATTTWNELPCTGGLTSWRRASADTPICVGSCDAMQTDGPRPSFCPPKYTTTAELPSLCGTPLPPGDPALIGQTFVEEMQRTYTIPCGGSDESSVASGGAPPLAANSCREAFCPAGTVEPSKVASCESDCQKHPNFCADTCEHCMDGGDCSSACLSCRFECQAACECDQYCHPLIQDAALCHEQGAQWTKVVSQNFDNIENAMMTLLEISTTEGWVDVMYAATDATGAYTQPLRGTNHGIYIPLFVIWIFLSFMFLLNLGVGVIVDKFMDMRESGKEMLTPSQKTWKKTRMALYGQSQVFSMENLHLLQYPQRKVYDFVEHRFFENTIMAAIVINTIVMALKVFPEPAANWDDSLAVINYIFAGIYTIEAGLKLYAYRANYYNSSWNCFDFFCVVATLLGFFIAEAMPDAPNVAPIMSVLRIFRIARLFRILKFMKGLNRLFMALMLSLPKLVNVVGILLLFLVLFSILGVQLFATTKLSETLNDHGNFQNFWRAFTTLFRASTGEAWNEIMHDLGKTEVDFFREKSWCAPADLYDTSDNFQLLKDKCLIEFPNSCVVTFWDRNLIPYIYWVLYTLLIGLVVMNLVISVILDGYEEGKQDDTATILVCQNLWPKYDPDHRMSIPLKEAVVFIAECVKEITGKELGITEGLEKMPIRYARAFDLAVGRNMSGQVHYKSAARQAIRFVAVISHPNPEDVLMELDDTDGKLDGKDKRRLKDLESRMQTGLMPGSQTEANTPADEQWGRAEQPLCAQVAAIKMQRMFRDRKVWQTRAFQGKPEVVKEEELVLVPPVAG